MYKKLIQLNMKYEILKKRLKKGVKHFNFLQRPKLSKNIQLTVVADIYLGKKQDEILTVM